MSDTGLTPTEQRVLEHLDEDALVDRLATLVRVPSVSGTPAEVEVVEVAAGMLADAAWRSTTGRSTWTRCAPTGFPGDGGRARAGEGWSAASARRRHPALVLQGHVDVVPPGDLGAWGGSDPFSAGSPGTAARARRLRHEGRGRGQPRRARAVRASGVRAASARSPCTAWSARRTAGSARSRPCGAATRGDACRHHRAHERRWSSPPTPAR